MAINAVSLSTAALCLVLSFAPAIGLGQSQGQTKPAPSPSPAQRQKVKLIWDFQKELGLTADQIQKIKVAVAQLQKDLVASQQKLITAEKELKTLIDEEASIDQITLKLRRIANLQVERRLADIQASRKINGALEPEQLEKWREIQQKTREGAKR